MPLVLDATPGGASSNSYCTAAEGDTYFLGHVYGSVWNAASTSAKETALVMATRVLDELYEWASWPSSATQALQWPRTGLLSKNQLRFLGNSEIPQQLKEATAEFARQLMVADRTADSDVETQGIQSLSAGPISIGFKQNVYAKVIPDAVRNMIPKWWYESGPGLANTRPVVRS